MGYSNYLTIGCWLVLYILLEQLQESVFRLLYNMAFAAITYPSGTTHYFALVYFTYAKASFSLTFGKAAQVAAVLYLVLIAIITWLVYEPAWSRNLRRRTRSKRFTKQLTFE